MHERSSSTTSVNSILSIQQQVQEYLNEIPATLQSTPTTETLPSDPAILKSDYLKLHSIALSQHSLIRKLKLELDLEQNRVKILRNETDALKRASVDIHAEHEKEEEKITNRLLKHIDGLKREKSDIISQMEQEEEAITNRLRKRLSHLEKEKLELEIALETESEFLVNKLAKQLDASKKMSPYASSTASLNHATPAEIGPDKELELLKARLMQVEKEHLARLSTYETQISHLKEEMKRVSDKKERLQ